MPRIKRYFANEESHSISMEFDNIDVKDRRIVDRLKKTADILEQEPEKSIPNACREWAKTKGAYRLLDNKKLTHGAILASHRAKTIERIKEHKIILDVQDTTKFDYSTHLKTEGLGPYSTSAKTSGLLMHTSMAVTTTGVPLGILAQDIWARVPEERGKRDQRKELPIAEKESNKWLYTMEKSLAGLPPGVMVVTVGDREADIYDLFLKATLEGQHLVIRAAQDRRTDKERLFAQVEKASVLGQCVVKVPRASKINQPPRDARLMVSACPILIQPPTKRVVGLLQPVPLYAVHAWEISPPPDVEPIKWLLLTTFKVESLQDAIEKIGWYSQRWKIERFHFTLKSGCRVEDLQLANSQRLKNAIAIYSVVAWKLTWITYQARETPAAPCDTILKKHEWQTLYCLVYENRKPPKKAPSLKEAVILIARLGGFLARKHDGDPGVKVLWRGLQRLNAALDVLKTLQSLPFGGDVGNG